MTLGKQIRVHRQEKRLSQEKVAELVGVSRQAVTKWEADQTMPSTENLFKLAEIFDITIDDLAAKAHPQKQTPAQITLSKDQEKTTGQNIGARWKRRILAALLISAGYLVIFLLGRLFCGDLKQSSFLGWLFGTDSRDYLFGWLLSSKMFWFVMGLSMLFSLFGTYRLSAATFFGFTLGIPLGELLGPYPAGIPYGHGHFGWAIWAGSVLLSLLVGAFWEILQKRKIRNSRLF